MSTLVPKEKGPNAPAGVETEKLVVRQPKILEHLLDDLKMIDSYTERVSERTGEDASTDLGAAGSAAGTRRDDRTSPRDQAIAAMPAEPPVLRAKLSQAIEREVRDLQKLARAAARASRPGDAFRLNQIYARIRRLNALLVEIFQATLEVLRRLYIRVFIDKQHIL